VERPLMGYVYVEGGLSCDGVSIVEIADAVGTPCYVYSAADIVSRYCAYDNAFGDLPHQVCYAVKANSNLSVLALLMREGAGFDIVSGGELFRVLKAGGDPAKIVFSGVGKTREELECALHENIGIFNCESAGEIELLNEIAGARNTKARIAVRVNPDVDAATHPYISTGLSEHKFGIDISEVEAVYTRANTLANIAVEGVSCHIGSQMLDAGPLMEAVDKMLALVERLRSAGIGITHLDLGGGIGVPYRPNDQAPEIAAVVDGIRRRVNVRDLKIMIEPGRSIIGEAGVLVTRVLYRKRTASKEFVIVDAAMNDLIRPALYKSYHNIRPVAAKNGRELITVDIVGPVCETSDFLARARDLEAVEPGELLAIFTAGAYGFVQASNYNSRPRAVEALVEGGVWRVIRARETYEDLVRGE
jgi:diaminopimelate decarboxylase